MILFKKSDNLLSFERSVIEAWVAPSTHELEVLGEGGQVDLDEGLLQLHPQLPLLAAQENLVGQVHRVVNPTERSPGAMRPTVFLVSSLFWPTISLDKAGPPEVVGHRKSVPGRFTMTSNLANLVKTIWKNEKMPLSYPSHQAHVVLTDREQTVNSQREAESQDTQTRRSEGRLRSLQTGTHCLAR